MGTGALIGRRGSAGVREAGLEPATNGLLIGGANGTRTRDPHTASVKRGVLGRIRASTACRIVHVGGLFPCSCVHACLLVIRRPRTTLGHGERVFGLPGRSCGRPPAQRGISGRHRHPRGQRPHPHRRRRHAALWTGLGVLGALGLRAALGLGGRLGLFPRNPGVAEMCLT
jgi:hypothetical protein